VTLPFVDEHSVEIPAKPDGVWDALWAVLGRTFGGTQNGRLSAATHSAYPGPHGRVYRALILPTGFHPRVVNRILSAIRRGASRDTPQAA
jgi:hypothetical protein